MRSRQASSNRAVSSVGSLRRGGHDHDRLAQDRVLDAERGTFADQARCVHQFFHLVGTDAIARGLDHLVAAADEVQVALRVAAHGVAREDRDLGQHEPAFAARQRLVPFRSLLRIVPVAHADQRPPLDELAGLVRAAGRAVLAQHQDLAVGDRLTDGIRPDVDLLRRKVGGAKRLGQAVHQEGLASSAAPPAVSSAFPAACGRRCSRYSADAR